MPFVSLAQNKLERQFFIRPGVDLSRFAVPYMNDNNQKAWEVNLDCEIKYRYFPVVELGSNSVKINTKTYEYKSEGSYMRFGFNYNMLNYRQRFDRNIFFVGFRYGISNFTHEAPYIKISNEWGDYKSSFENTNINAHWTEFVIGLRGEILKNIYLGYTFRVKQMLKHSDYNNLAPYWTPGFGKGSSGRLVGMSYSISYAIPIKNPKPILPEGY
ncbi:MAG: hypothetical protein JEZ09_20455 [Salinivirgaceae bacterium]|nr:hypothetical protein [Salinivirgaceae bacterium]